MELPNSLSPDELKALLAEAKSEDEAHKEAGPYGGYTKQQMEDIVEKNCQDLIDKVRSPMADKVALVFRLNRFISWHEEVALMHAREGTDDKIIEQVSCGLGWAEDLGKLKTALNIILNVNLGSDDYFCDNDEDDD